MPGSWGSPCEFRGHAQSVRSCPKVLAICCLREVSAPGVSTVRRNVGWSCFLGRICVVQTSWHNPHQLVNKCQQLPWSKIQSHQCWGCPTDSPSRGPRGAWRSRCAGSGQRKRCSLICYLSVFQWGQGLWTRLGPSIKQAMRLHRLENKTKLPPRTSPTIHRDQQPCLCMAGCCPRGIGTKGKGTSPLPPCTPRGGPWGSAHESDFSIFCNVSIWLCPVLPGDALFVLGGGTAKKARSTQQVLPEQLAF